MKEDEKLNLQEEALNILNLFALERDKYDKVNRQIRKLMGDFPSTVQFMDTYMESALCRLLDIILGDEIASYFLYEATGMKGGGCIVDNGVEYKIKDFLDVVKYVYRDK